jgi:hypothetical protein
MAQQTEGAHSGSGFMWSFGLNQRWWRDVSGRCRHSQCLLAVSVADTADLVMLLEDALCFGSIDRDVHRLTLIPSRASRRTMGVSSSIMPALDGSLCRVCESAIPAATLYSEAPVVVVAAFVCKRTAIQLRGTER